MRVLTKILGTLLISVLLGLSGAACPGNVAGSDPGDQPAPASEPVTVTINILGNHFDVEHVTVPLGSTVIWHNTTSAQHGIISEVFDADLRPGQDFHYTFRDRGSFRVRSRTHTSASRLTCTIVVE